MPVMLCQCGAKSEVRPTMAGTTIHCPQCGSELAVPALRVLQAYADRGEAVPAAATPRAKRDVSEPSGGVPESFVAHFCGEVGSNGRVSVAALKNFVGVLLDLVDRFATQIAESTQLECMISCALLPEHKKLILVETSPAGVESDSVRQLQARIEETPAPPIVDGPVAFAIYRRVNIGEVDQPGVQPFAPYRQSIKEQGLDAALMGAAGATIDQHTNEHGKQTLFERVRRYFGFGAATSPKNDEPSPAEVYRQMETWLEEAEQHFAEASTEELERFIVDQPENLACHAALAARYVATQHWSKAIARYTAALSIDSGFLPIYGHRALAYFASGNRQAALAEWNQAIELAPYAPWLFFHRSEVYADLEAWSQAETDLDAAWGLAPREPAFLLARARIREQRDNVPGAMDDLKQVLQLDPHSGQGLFQLGRILYQRESQNLNTAVDHLTRAVHLMPGEVGPRIHRSIAYTYQNKYELAREDCEAVIEMQPELGVGYGLRGRILQLQGEFAEAIESCNRALDLGFETSMVFLARGYAYAATDRPELALSDCKAALALEPDNPLASQLHGMLSMEQGELDTAMEALTKACKIAPEWVEPREQLAMLHRMNENPQAAVEEQSILVTQQPNNAAHYVNRAFAYTQLGDYEKAEQDYHRACELDPENEQIFYLRGCFFLDRQEAELALHDFDRVLEMADDCDDARLRRATILLQLKRHKEALGDFGKLIAKHPDDPRAYTGRAYAHQMIGDEDAADADFSQLRQMMPEQSLEMTIQSLSAKVQRLESEGKYDKAIEAAEEIIEIAPEAPIGYRLRAWIYWYTERYVEAYDDYTRLLGMSPDDPSVLNSRGHVQAEMGEFRSALDDLDASIEGSRKAGQTQLLAFALNGRAFALGRLGRIDESTQDYEESIRLCPTNAWAYFNRAIVMYEREDHSQAKKLFEMALQSFSPPLTKRKRDRAQAFLRKTR